MGYNRLHALMLMHVHKNILNNINTADVAVNLLKEKTTANKHSDIFLRIIHNICEIKLKLRHFSYIYIAYQIYMTWSCVTFCQSFSKFPQANDNRISTS